MIELLTQILFLQAALLQIDVPPVIIAGSITKNFSGWSEPRWRPCRIEAPWTRYKLLADSRYLPTIDREHRAIRDFDNWVRERGFELNESQEADELRTARIARQMEQRIVVLRKREGPTSTPLIDPLIWHFAPDTFTLHRFTEDPLRRFVEAWEQLPTRTATSPDRRAWSEYLVERDCQEPSGAFMELLERTKAIRAR